jgi:hypothetical protein
MKFWYSLDRTLTGFRVGSDAVDKRKVTRALAGIKPQSFERTAHIVDTALTEISNLTNKMMTKYTGNICLRARISGSFCEHSYELSNCRGNR